MPEGSEVLGDAPADSARCGPPQVPRLRRLLPVSAIRRSAYGAVVPNQGATPIMLAYTYPLLSIFWTMLEFFVFVLWIWLLISIFIDIFRSHDMGGLAKALWVLFVIILPFLGVLVYLIARGGSMHERAEQQAAGQQKAFDDYVKQAAGASGAAAPTSWPSWPT